MTHFIYAFSSFQVLVLRFSAVRIYDLQVVLDSKNAAGRKLAKVRCKPLAYEAAV